MSDPTTAESVREDAGNSAPPAAPIPQTCRNCGAHASGHYCANCGQETRIALPTFAAFMREAAGRYIAWDGRTWRTLAALVGRPGYLTLEYLNGRRKRYIRPARLFLVLYLLLFAVIGIVQSPVDLKDDVVIVEPDQARGPIDEAANEFAKDRAKAAPAKSRGKPTVSIVNSDDGDTLLGLDKDLNLALRWNGAEIALPAPVQKRWEHFRKLSKDEKAEQLYAGILRFGPYAMVVLLPAFALLMKLAYLGRSGKYPGRPQRYAEHLVYSAHLHAFAAIMILLLVLVPVAPLRFAIVAWVLFYAMRARQLVYRGRWWGGLLRAMVVATCYVMLMAMAIMGLLVAAIVVYR